MYVLTAGKSVSRSVLAGHLLSYSGPDAGPPSHTGRMADADESLEEACDVTVGLAECYAEGCWGECTLQMVKPFATLCILCMAAESGAYVLKPLNLPTITLFIFFGVLIGPFGMSMLSTVDVGRLSWINEV